MRHLYLIGLLLFAFVLHLKAQFLFLGPQDSVANQATHGQVNCMVFDPTDSLRMWAGTKGGLWYTTNGGNLWTQQGTDTLRVISVTDAVLVPGSKDSIVMMLGDRDRDRKQNFTPYNWWYATSSYATDGAVYTSTNNGQLWTQVPWEGGVTISPYEIQGMSMSCLAAPETPTNSWLFEGDMGIYRCPRNLSNFGHAFEPANGYQLLRKPGNGALVYATANGGVALSVDSGKTYSSPAVKLNPIAVRTQLAIAPSRPSTVYGIASDQSGSFLGCYRSVDDGQTWELRSSSPNILCPYTTAYGPSGGGVSCLSLTVSPQNPDVVFAGSILIWKSVDAGVTWTCISSPDERSTNFVSRMIHRLDFSKARPDWLFASTGNGVFKTTDFGVTWTSFSKGILSSNINGVCAAGDDDSVVFTASPVGTYRCNRGVWSKVYDSASVQIRTNRDHPEKVFLVSSFGYQLLSTDGGKTFKQSRSPSDCTPSIDLHPYYQSKIRPSLMFANLKTMYVSGDEGRTWTPVFNDFGKTVVGMALSDVDSMRVYALTSDFRVWQSRDAGKTWSAGKAPTSYSFPVGICVRPNTVDTVLVYTPYQIAISSNAGNNYTLCWVTDFTNRALLNNLYWKRDQCSEELLLGTNQGVFQATLTNNAINYTVKMDGLPNTPVRDFSLSGQDLYLATAGRGVWHTHYQDVEARAIMQVSKDTACPGESILFNNHSQFTNGHVDWAFDQGIPPTSKDSSIEVSFQSGGDHIVSMSVYGCGPTTVLQRAVHIIPRQKARITLSATELCVGDTLVIQDVSTMSFENRSLILNNHDTIRANADFFRLPCTITGTNTLHFQRSNRCSADSLDKTFVVHEAPATPEFTRSADTLLCADPQFVWYQWYFNGVAISGATTSQYIIHNEGDYYLKARTAIGCTANSTSKHLIPFNTSDVRDYSINDIILHPNPAHDLIRIEIPNVSLKSINPNIEVQLYSMLGEHLTTINTSCVEDLVLPITGLSAGQYLLHFQCGTVVRIVSFIKL